MYYLFVSYVKILRFYPKKILIGSLLGEVRFFRAPRTTQKEKKFELGKKKIFFFSFVNPLYEPILFFPKFDPITLPGMALRVNLGP